MKKRAWLRNKLASVRDSLSPPPSEPNTPRTSISRDRLRAIFPPRSARDLPSTSPPASPLPPPPPPPPTRSARPAPPVPPHSPPPLRVPQPHAPADSESVATPPPSPPSLNTPPPSPSTSVHQSDSDAPAPPAVAKKPLPPPAAKAETIRRLNSRGPQKQLASNGAAASSHQQHVSTSSVGDTASQADTGSGGGRRSGRDTPSLSDEAVIDPHAARLVELSSYQSACVEHFDSNAPLRGGSPPGTPAGPGMHAVLTTFRLQHYLLGAHAALRRRDERFGTQFAHVPPAHAVDFAIPRAPGKQESFFRACTDVAFEVDTALLDGPATYHVRRHDDTLLHVTRSATPRVSEVRAGVLFEPTPDAAIVGRVHEFASKQLLFAFVPDREFLPHWPRLEMKESREWAPLDDDSMTLQLAIASEHERVVGRVVVLRHYYDVRIWDSSKAEAVLWIAIVLAAGLHSRNRR